MPFGVEERRAFLESEGPAQEGVVADFGVQIERQMGAVDGQVAIQGLVLILRRVAATIGCTPDQKSPWWTSNRVIPCSTARSIVQAQASTAAPTFVTVPEFSICNPFQAPG